jgi:predicted nuclease of predicted toxin-antitoxin system
VARLVVDENMPRTTAPILRAEGHIAVDVRDAGLRGADDAEIFAFAQASHSALITADRDFSSVLSFRPGTHAGIVVVRLPNHFPNDAVNREIVRALGELSEEELTGAIVVIEPGRTRVRRPAPE